MTTDIVTLALIQNYLDHLSFQMGQVMQRTSVSPAFTESHDFSCFITDGSGQLISQADGIPIHTGGGGFIVQAILSAFDGSIQAEDVFLSSDPYTAGGNHLPDWVITRPVFSGGQLLAFVCNRAHQSDIGGGAAGTYNPEATEIFHEGIRLPALRLVERGKLREDLWQLLLINSRSPDLIAGDLKAMLGSTRVGMRRVLSLAEEYGIENFQGYLDGILAYGDRRMRATLEALPDGDYEGSEKTDNDCFETRDVWVRVTLRKRGEHLTVDFTGTDPQMKGFKNSSVANTHAAVYVALTSYFDPKIPRNAGTYRSIDLLLPEGSLVNPRPPAPMTMCTVLPAHEIIHACWKALAQAAPERACAGWGKIGHCNMTGPKDGGSIYVMYHWGALPAAGAVVGRDGFNQIGLLNTLGNLVIPNCETYEQIYPVRFLRHEFRCDSGGAGEFRGGTGVEYAVHVEEEAEYAFRGEGQRTPSGYGVQGGGAGAPGSCMLSLDDGRIHHPPQFGVLSTGPATLRIESAAGGGWGSPFRRDPNRVLRDVLDGVVSRESACSKYGVALSADGWTVDWKETLALRARLGERSTTSLND